MAYTSLKSYSGPTAYWIQVPGTDDFDPLDYSRASSPSPEMNDSFILQDLIEGTSSIEKNIPSKIRLAIYDGLKELDIDTGNSSDMITGLFPISYVESLVEYYETANIKRFFNDENDNPFRLDYLFNNIYNKFESIDTTMPYKFSFELKDDFNIRAIFIIRNREFVCSKVEKTVEIEGYKKYALGYFYPKNKE